MTRYIILFLLTGCFFSAAPKPTSVGVKSIEGLVFGSTYNIRYIGDLAAQDFQRDLEIFFRKFNEEFSTYDRLSVISKFNELAAQERMSVSPRFIEMIKIVQRLHAETKGAFDPTLSPVIKLWGFGGGKTMAPPSSAELKMARSQVGMEHLRIDEKNLQVWKTISGLALDLNAFAPGWVADLVGEILVKQNIQNFMIDIGGEILTKGEKAPGESWIIGIEQPSTKEGHQVRIIIKMSNMALATSGNYRQYFDDQGMRRSHIIDPKTGAPVTHLIASASIIAPTAVDADAWGTAMMVGGKEALELASKQGYKVYLLEAKDQEKFETITNPAMQEYLAQNQL